MVEYLMRNHKVIVINGFQRGGRNIVYNIFIVIHFLNHTFCWMNQKIINLWIIKEYLEDMKYCKKCGTENTPDSLYCENCGNKLEVSLLDEKTDDSGFLVFY